MNLLIAGRHGSRLYYELRQSETAWQALRFYDPVQIPIGVFIRIYSLSAALSLASDLRYFMRRYSSIYLFEISPGVFCTHALAKKRYLSRDMPFSEPWPWKLWYWITYEGEIKNFYCNPSNDETLDLKDTNGTYILEVWCLKEEYSKDQYQFKGSEFDNTKNEPD